MFLEHLKHLIIKLMAAMFKGRHSERSLLGQWLSIPTNNLKP